jgi:hypothetical protein
MERTRGAACQFVDSVCYMLLSTRVLSYSWPQCAGEAGISPRVMREHVQTGY